MVGDDLAKKNASETGKKVRPRGIEIVAMLQIIVGFLAFAYDVYSVGIFSTRFVPGGGAGIAQVLITFGLIIAGIFSLGYGILEGWHWTWLTVIILDALGLAYVLLTLTEELSRMIMIMTAPSFNSFASTFGYLLPVVAVCSTELWYFTRKRTKLYFYRRSS
jgi:hypothetical protein